MGETFRGRAARRGARGQQISAAAVASAFPVRRWLEARWFVLVAAAAMFVGVFVLRQTNSDASGAIALLYTVPVAVIALELGMFAGLGAAALALALVGIWAIDAHAHLGVVGVMTRAVAFGMVGGIAGRFGDRMRDAHRRQFLLLRSGLTLAHLDAAEDLPATLAAQARELVSARAARVELTDGPAADAGAPRPGGVVDELPIEVRGVRYGTLAVNDSRSTSLEDHAMLAILALQAAVAAENRRLLVSERERAMIHAELQVARLDLAERGRQLRELLRRQEAERHQLAYELNEQAAQSLAAVLLSLAALEREFGTDGSKARVDALRSDIDATLRSLRALAVSLRPPVLMLGLQAALERLAERLRGGVFGSITVDLHGAHYVNEETETMVYRVIEEALDAVGAARLVSVTTRADGDELVIEVDDADRPIAQQRLAVLRARMEVIGGHLSGTPTSLRVVIPLAPAEEQASRA
jgi:signal transduction histidine kinase